MLVICASPSAINFYLISLGPTLCGGGVHFYHSNLVQSFPAFMGLLISAMIQQILLAVVQQYHFIAQTPILCKAMIYFISYAQFSGANVLSKWKTV